MDEAYIKECNIMVFDYSCLAVIDLINVFILFVVPEN